MTTLILGVLLLPLATTATDPAVARQDENGFLVHEIESDFQRGTTKIRVLLPDKVAKDQQLPVVYFLPVEAGSEHRYGDGLLEAKKLDLHNKYAAILVAPSFSQLPWYADHPTDRALRQESYFLKVVVPLIEKTYPAQRSADGRMLLGFSKSGWGAWSLLLRHPDKFGRAVAWDAPLMMERLDKYGTKEIFGDQKTFEKYRIADLLKAQAKELGGKQRFILTGYDNFRTDHQQVHALLEKLEVPHVYRDGPQRKHDWHSGWVEEAMTLLMKKDEK